MRLTDVYASACGFSLHSHLLWRSRVGFGVVQMTTDFASVVCYSQYRRYLDMRRTLKYDLARFLCVRDHRPYGSSDSDGSTKKTIPFDTGLRRLWMFSFPSVLFFSRYSSLCIHQNSFTEQVISEGCSSPTKFCATHQNTTRIKFKP